MDENNRLNEEYIEIDLKEYLYILWKNKLLIISIIVLSVLGAFLFSNYFMTNIYTVSTSVRLTNLSNSIYSNGNAVARVIKSRNFIEEVQSQYDLDLNTDYINRLLSDQSDFLTISINDEQFIEITVKGEEPETITKVSDSLANHLITLTEEDINIQKEMMREHISSLEQEKDTIMELNNDINNIIKNISETEASQMEINYLQNTLMDIKKSINEFSLNTLNQIFSIRDNLNNITSAQFISEAELPENPSEPNIKLNLAIAFVLGVFLAIFIVFIKQFLKGTDWSEYEDK